MGVTISTDIRNDGNTLEIDEKSLVGDGMLKVTICGVGNKVTIKKNVTIAVLLHIFINDNNTTVFIDENTTFEQTDISISEPHNYVIIGKDCMFSRQTYILASDYHSILDSNGDRINFATGVSIEDHVWVGWHATILKNCYIRSNSVIAAHALVVGDVPANSIVGGVPAKLLKRDITWTRERASRSQDTALNYEVAMNTIDTDRQKSNVEQFPNPTDPCLRGWAFIEGEDAFNSTIFVEVTDISDQVFILLADSIQRPDVATYFNCDLYSHSGFYCKIPNYKNINKIRILIINDKLVTSNSIIKPQYFCPCCEYMISQFNPLPSYYQEKFDEYGYPWREDNDEMLNAEQYFCPQCGATDRERLYAICLSRFFSHEDFLSLLDIAPSVPLGNYIKRNFRNIHYVTGDLTMDNVDYNLDITNMEQIYDESFDCFICSHVLEHVEDDRKAMKELFRVLKQGGRGILVVPIDLNQKETEENPQADEAERWRRFGQDDHIRKYSKKDWVQKIKDTGFVLQELNISDFGTDVFFRCGLSTTSTVYFVNR